MQAYQLTTLIVLLSQLCHIVCSGNNKQDATTIDRNPSSSKSSDTIPEDLHNQLLNLRNQLLQAKFKTRLLPLQSILNLAHNPTEIKSIDENSILKSSSDSTPEILNWAKNDTRLSTFRARKGEQQQQNQQTSDKNRNQNWLNSSSTTTMTTINLLNTRSISNSNLASDAINWANNNDAPHIIRSQRQKWSLMELALGDQLDLMSTNIKQSLDKLLMKTNVSSACSNALADLTHSLSDQQMWAIQMLDASAHHLPSGFLEGTLTELGHFDQCLSIKRHTTNPDNRHPSNRSKETRSNSTRDFQGQYCTLIIKPPLLTTTRTHQRFQTICGVARNAQIAATRSAQHGPSSSNETMIAILKKSIHFQYTGLRLGLCTPSACSKNDLQLLLNNYLAKWHLLGSLKSCQISKHNNEDAAKVWPEFDQVQWSIIIAIGGLLSLNIIATLCECYTLTFDDNNEDLCDGKSKSNSFSRDVLENNRNLRTDELQRKASRHAKTNRTSTCLRNKRLVPVDEISAVDGRHWRYQVYKDNDDMINSDQIGHFHAIELEPQKNPLHHGHRDTNTVKNQNSYGTSAESGQPHPVGLKRKDQSNASQNEESWLQHLQQNSISSCDEVDMKKAAQAKTRPVNYHDETTMGKQRLAKSNHDSGFVKLGKLTWSQKLYQMLICFGLMKNLRFTFGLHTRKDKTLSSFIESNSKTIPILDGIRTVSMIWIIFGATFQSASSDMMGNLFQMGEITCSSRLFQALLNTSLAIETLFVISGILTITSLVRKSLCTKHNHKDNQKSSQNDLNDHHHHQFTMSDRKIMLGSSQNSSIGSTLGGDHLMTVSSTNTTTTSSSLLDDYDSQPSPSSERNVNNNKQRKKLNSEYSKLSEDKTQSRDKKKTTTRNGDGDDDDEPVKLFAFQPLLWLSMRYLRLAPSYSLVMSLVILLPPLGSGPFWLDSMSQLTPENCRTNWYLNLLFVNNHFEGDKLCLNHSWSLSNDMQFYLLALILFGLYYHSLKRFTLLLWLVIFAACTATNHALTIINQFPPSLLPTWPTTSIAFNNQNNNIDQLSDKSIYRYYLYNKPWPHLPSYLIGLTIGYTLLQYDSDSWTLSAAWRFFGWILSSLVALSLINSLYPWNLGLMVDETLTGIYACTFRSLWALCLSWFIYELATRGQAPLARLLGWSGFQLPSRLTYICYLVHPIVIQLRMAALRERLDFTSPSTLAGHFLANLTLSYLCATILAIVLDSPIVQLSRLAFQAISDGNPNVRCQKCSPIDDSGADRNVKSSCLRSQPALLQSSVKRSHPSLDYSWNLGSPSSLDSCNNQQSPIAESHRRHNATDGHSEDATSRHERELDQSYRRDKTGINYLQVSSNKVVVPSNEENLKPSPRNRAGIISSVREKPTNQAYDNSLLMSILSTRSSSHQNHSETHESRKRNFNYSNNNYKNLSDGCSPDPDFQQKLAQAISKGFRLRNQMAMVGGINKFPPRVNKTPTIDLSNASTFGRHILRKKRLEPAQIDVIAFEKNHINDKFIEKSQCPDIDLEKFSRSSKRVTTFLPSGQQ